MIRMKYLIGAGPAGAGRLWRAADAQGETRTADRTTGGPGGARAGHDQCPVESDGCYWYRYAGPVEITYLPLLTRDGRMICTRPQ
jgi:hypothetical protein